jgi:hypothetical protein
MLHLIKSGGTIAGITYSKPLRGKHRRGASIKVYVGKKNTMVGLGVTPEEFDRQYSIAVQKLVEFHEAEISSGARAVLEETKTAFLRVNGIGTKQVTVFDFIEL